MRADTEKARRVLIAPDSFKGTVSAREVAEAIAEGWSLIRPSDHVILAPMADGGEGSLAACEVAVPGSLRQPVRVTGPEGELVDASWLLLPDGTAFVELAATSGIGLMTSLRPFDAHTLGFGQAIVAALDAGARSLVLALGGSGSTDAGAGVLTALGARFLDSSGTPVPSGNRGLHSLATIDLSELRALPSGGVRILSDVTNPLEGPLGAAAVFGPQKGASEKEVAQLAEGVSRCADLLDPTGIWRPTPGSGAAGGVGFALLAWGATIEAGAAAVGNVLGLPELIAHSDIVITGEGRFDQQTAAGKVAHYVAQLAREHSIPAFLVAGSIDDETIDFAHAESLTTLAGDPSQAMDEPCHWLRVAGGRLAECLL